LQRNKPVVRLPTTTTVTVTVTALAPATPTNSDTPTLLLLPPWEVRFQRSNESFEFSLCMGEP
jgi:hypothetical protein